MSTMVHHALDSTISATLTKSLRTRLANALQTIVSNTNEKLLQFAGESKLIPTKLKDMFFPLPIIPCIKAL
jgi:hypothetical protein